LLSLASTSLGAKAELCINRVFLALVLHFQLPSRNLHQIELLPSWACFCWRTSILPVLSWPSQVSGHLLLCSLPMMALSFSLSLSTSAANTWLSPPYLPLGLLFTNPWLQSLSFNSCTLLL
jgi:hypothetical protein